MANPDPISTPDAAPDAISAPDPVEAPIPNVSFEEYRLYYESAEKVTDRRLEINRWNYSIAVTTLIAIGLMLVWATANRTHVYAGVAGIVMLSVMAFLHCSFWVRQIDDFKALNAAKFDIVNQMAPHVRFQSAGPYERIGSAEPFKREWYLLDKENGLQQIKRGSLRHVFVLKSSSAEYFVPNAFRVLYVVVAVGTLVLGIFHTQSFSPFDIIDK